MRYLLLLLLAGCASTSYNGITTTSACYDAKYAYTAGLNQAQTKACNDEAQAIFWDKLGNTSWGSVDCLKAGNAFEACVDRSK